MPLDAGLNSAETAHLWRVAQLDGLSLLRAHFVTYAFKRHVHDYFVIGMVEAGVQQFAHEREHYVTLPTGLILINPDEPHTGEAAVPDGFGYRALYPDAATMARIAAEVSDKHIGIPFFKGPLLHDPTLFAAFRGLHLALESGAGSLEQESRYLWALGQLILRHAYQKVEPRPTHAERPEVARLKRLIEERYAEDLTLDELAKTVAWNPFYMLRVFRGAVGLPPHAYLESVRVRQAQRLLRARLPLAEVAYATGFSSQSHFTTTFKRLIGVTPGQYGKQAG